MAGGVRRRVHVTSPDRVAIVTAQPGSWARVIGAAVHGAAAAVRPVAVV